MDRNQYSPMSLMQSQNDPNGAQGLKIDNSEGRNKTGDESSLMLESVGPSGGRF